MLTLEAILAPLQEARVSGSAWEPSLIQLLNHSSVVLLGAVWAVRSPAL